MPVNSVSVTVPMTAEMKAWVAKQAKEERRTMAEIVRFCVEKEMVWQKIIQDKEEIVLKERVITNNPTKETEGSP